MATSCCRRHDDLVVQIDARDRQIRRLTEKNRALLRRISALRGVATKLRNRIRRDL